MAKTTLYNTSRPFIEGEEFSFSVFLFQRVNSQLIQISPSINVGDVKISKDAGNYNNIANLPVEIDSSGELVVTLTSTETTGILEYLTVKFSDVSGSQWCDLVCVLELDIPAIVDLDNLDSPVSSVPTNVWNNPVRTLTSSGGGATPSEIWSYPNRSITSAEGVAQSVWSYETRTLTNWQTVISDIWKVIPIWFLRKIEVMMEPGITIYKGISNTIPINGSGNIKGASNIIFTIKDSYQDLDSDSIIRIEFMRGLVTLNGETYPDSSNGEITIIDETNGLVNITIHSKASSLLIPSQKRLYDVVSKVGDEVRLVARGKIDILPDVTNSV